MLCRLYVQWRFLRGIEAQFLALQKGFNELIPQHLLRPFDERELEVRVYGLFAFSMGICVYPKMFVAACHLYNVIFYCNIQYMHQIQHKR